MPKNKTAREFLTFAHGVDLALGNAMFGSVEASVFLTGALDVFAEDSGLPKEYRCFSTDEAYIAGRNAAILFLTSDERAERRKP